MNQERSSTRLKISSTKAPVFFIFYALLAALVVGCSDVEGPRPDEALSAPQKQTVGKVPVPPWQLWAKDDFGSEPIREAEQALLYGELESAVEKYQEAYEQAELPKVKDEALVRLCGTLLKLGRSQRALETISQDAKDRAVQTTGIGERQALLAAYAYLHQRDYDQALAWLSTAIQTSAGKTVYGNRAKEQALDVISGMSNADFERYSQRWTPESNIGPMFVRERLRRAQGGTSMTKVDLAEYFVPATYGSTQAVIAETQTAKATVSDTGINNRRIGVLLPLSGEYAEHGAKARQGIELAVLQAGSGYEIVVGDTKGDAATAEIEYDRLARDEHVAMVLGPLLVKDSERVAAKSQEVGIPFIAFTKRSGLPSLGSSVYRLGATVENQVDELLNYSTSELHFKTFAVIYPQSAAGHEFAASFKQSAAKFGAKVVADAGYMPQETPSIMAAVAQATSKPADAVFLPENLEQLQDVLQQLQGSSLSKAVRLGPAQWNDPVAVRGYGQLLEGAVYVTPFNAKSVRPEVVDFVARYREKFQREPELLAAQGYDAARLAISALAQPVQSAEDIRNRLNGVNSFAGVTGKLSIDSDGEITRRMSVVRMHMGEAVEVMASGAVAGFYAGKDSAPSASTSSPVSEATGARTEGSGSLGAVSTGPVSTNSVSTGSGLMGVGASGKNERTVVNERSGQQIKAENSSKTTQAAGR